MRTLQKLSLVAGVTAVLALAPLAIANAMSGSDDKTTDSSGSTTTTTSTSTSTSSGSSKVKVASTSDDDSSDDKSSTTEQKNRLEAQKEALHEATEKIAAQRAAVKAAVDEHKGKLTEAKLKLCQKRQDFVDKKMDQLAARETKQLELLDTVSSRLQKYVSTKQLTVANYDALLMDITTKQAAAKANLTDLQAQKGNFKCDGDNPKGAVTTYLSSLRSTNTALKDYRDSIKKLLLAVKAVHPQDVAKTDDNSAKKEQQ